MVTRRMSDLSSDLASLRITRDQAPQKRTWPRVVLWLGATIGAVYAGYSYGLPYLEARVFQPKVNVTEIALVSPAQASVQLTATGYVVPQRVSNVGSQIAGRVAKVYVQEGDQVKAGDLIAELEDAEQRAALSSAKSRIATAKAQVGAARANLAEVDQQARRERSLAQRGITGSAAADDLEARATALTEQVHAAQAEVRAAQSQLGALEINLEYTKVLAPIDGRVIGKPVQAGELVGGMQGVRIAELADFSTLMLEADIPESRLHVVKIEGPTEVVLDAYPDRRLRGKVAEISPRVNRAKATVMVKIAFVDSTEDVLPDMAGRVNFLTEALDAQELKEPPKTVVPASAIVQRSGATVVFVYDEGRVRMTPVELGPAFGTGFELTQGPPPGTNLISDPPSTLQDGDAVKQETES